MRKSILLFFILISTNLCAQDWVDKIAKKVYSTIDSSRKYECCDKLSGAITIEYTHEGYELPFDDCNKNSINSYYEQIMDSTTIESITKDIVESYYSDIPKKYRTNFDRSCFNSETKTTIENRYHSDLYFIEGKFHISFMFQTKKPLKINFFKWFFGIL